MTMDSEIGVISWLLLTTAVLIECTPEYREECSVWKNVTSTLMYNNTVPMNCEVNLQCTGIDCTSEFSYAGPITLGQNYTVDFCFGIAIHPCSEPLEVHFYVENPGEDPKDTYQKTVQNGTQFQLPGVHYSLNRMGEADGFVTVIMEEEKHFRGSRYVKLGMMYKTRIQAMFGLYEDWPDSLAFRLIPDTMVPVPDCQPSVATPTHPPGTCVKYVPPTVAPGATTLHPPTPGSSCETGTNADCPQYAFCRASSPGSKSGTCTCFTGYHMDDKKCILHHHRETHVSEKECEMGTFGECGNHQECVKTPDSKAKGKCQCMKEYFWSHDKCVQTNKTDEPMIYGYVDDSKDEKKSSHVNIIIVVAVAVVVFVMALAAAFVVVKYRRYKERYGQHTMLIGDEDDRDDDDAAMVEA